MDQRLDITGTQMFPFLIFCISPQANGIAVPAIPAVFCQALLTAFKHDLLHK